MGNTILSIISLLQSLSIFIIGMMLIVSGKDNQAKWIIGFIATFIAALIFASQATFLTGILDHTAVESSNMIIAAHTVFILLLSVILLSLFPIFALNPDWSIKKVSTIITLPIFILGIAYLPFFFSIIEETPLYSEGSLTEKLNVIVTHFNNFDVILRFFILLLIIIIPSAIFVMSSLIHISHKNRKPTLNFKIYYAALFILTFIACAYSLGIPYFHLIIVLYLPTFAIVILIGYYHNASYLTTFVNVETSSEEETKIQEERKIIISSADASFLDIWNKMDELVKKDERFTNPDLQIQNIADEMNINKTILNDALHRKGFNGFKEYLNDVRLNKFKIMAEQNPGREISDLYESAGFTSKTTFYRIFSLVEGITPSEYMKKLSKFNTM